MENNNLNNLNEEEIRKSIEQNFEKIVNLRNTLLELPSNSLIDSLFILIDYIVDNGPDGSYCDSFGDIGISIGDDGISIDNITEEKTLATLNLTMF